VDSRELRSRDTGGDARVHTGRDTATMAKGRLFPGSRPFSVGAKPITDGSTLSR